jgi:hypothetical protein
MDLRMFALLACSSSEQPQVWSIIGAEGKDRCLLGPQARGRGSPVGRDRHWHVHWSRFACRVEGWCYPVCTVWSGGAGASHEGPGRCNLVNKLKPGSVKSINKSKMPFPLMENIGNFLAAAKGFGVKPTDL